jgi:hypothetical protein
MSSGSKRNTNDQIVQGMLTVASAVKQYFANKTLPIDGKPWKSGDIVTFLQEQAAAMQNANELHASWLQAVAKNTATYVAQVKPMLASIKSYVIPMLGTASAAFRAFGFALPKKAQPDVETKAGAVAKLRATRAARNTMGKKQRLAIKGVVQPVLALPAATSSSASPVTAPATGSSQPSGSNGQSH